MKVHNKFFTGKLATTRQATGLVSKQKSQNPTPLKDGLSDDMKAMLEHLESPKAESRVDVTQDGSVTLRKGGANPGLAAAPAPDTVATKADLKEPRSSYMEEMVSNMNSAKGPVPSERLMVGPGGVIAYESTAATEEQICKKTRTTALIKKAASSPRGLTRLSAALATISAAAISHFAPALAFASSALAATSLVAEKISSLT